ncbi:hypothetical protein LWC05_02440 [Acetobacter sicerae]|uniref:Uncharacterized protein n=1 Tax=Acetobacter sicerae TaxID=85325 RepID=A0ABS8VQ35_9PROT|nr:hypothetical protein [Acetobacter sicerae]MCE0742757.1 hypothetical protein [Acetobacter sicerae]
MGHGLCLPVRAGADGPAQRELAGGYGNAEKFPAIFPHDPVASLKRFWLSEKEIISDVLLQLN